MTSPVSISLWANNCSLFLQKFTTRKNWRITLIAILTVISLVLSSAPAVSFKDPQWKSFEQKREHPLSILQYDAGTNMAKRNYRLTVPLIAKIFRLNDWMVYALQFVVNILFLFIALLLAEKITGDKVSGMLTAIGVAFIYTGDAGFVDRWAWFDEFAFLFLILAMLSKKPYLVFCWLQLACWVDERAIIASFGIFIWWKLQELTFNGFSLKSFFRVGSNSSIAIISVIVYAIGRIALKLIVHLPSPSGNVGLHVLIHNDDYMGMGLWEALEGFWILSILGLALLLNDRKSLLLFLIAAFMCMTMITAFSVFDITRSAAYMFPVIFIFLYLIKERFSLEDTRIILMTSSIICFIFPCYGIISPLIYYDTSILVRLMVFIRSGVYY